MDKLSKISEKLISLNSCYIFKPRLQNYLEEGEMKLLNSLDKIEANI
jgi:hypothetical protein